MLYIIRHGSTVSNESKITIGSTDAELSKFGRNQISQTFNRLAEMGCQPHEIWSSPANRCKETALILSQSFPGHIKLKVLEALRERDFGIFENTPRRELIKAKNSLGMRDLEDPTQDWDGTTLVESDEQIWNRLKSVMATLAELEHKDNQDRIVVTHSGTTRVILKYLCGATAGERTRIYIGNGGIVRLWTNKKTANITIDQVYNPKQKG